MKVVALFGSSGEYMLGLTSYMRERKQMDAEFAVFTKMEELQKFVEQVHTDLLLFDLEKPGDREVSAEEISHLEMRVGQLVFLDGENCGEENHFFKYQSMERLWYLMVQSMQKMAEISGDTLKGLGRIICVFSPAGGAGTTTLAGKIAEEMGKERKTFLLPLELFSAGRGGEEEKKGFSELLYYLKQENKKILFHLEEMKQKTGSYETILPGDNPLEYLCITQENLILLVNLLQTEAGYERLVVDVGFISEAVLELMERADEIRGPKPKTQTAKDKLKFWEEGMRRMGKGHLVEKYHTEGQGSHEE